MYTPNPSQHHISEQVKIDAWVWISRAIKNTPLPCVPFLLSLDFYFILLFSKAVWNGREGGRLCVCVCVCVRVRVCVRVGNFEYHGTAVESGVEAPFSSRTSFL